MRGTGRSCIEHIARDRGARPGTRPTRRQSCDFSHAGFGNQILQLQFSVTSPETFRHAVGARNILQFPQRRSPLGELRKPTLALDAFGLAIVLVETTTNAPQTAIPPTSNVRRDSTALVSFIPGSSDRSRKMRDATGQFAARSPPNLHVRSPEIVSKERARRRFDRVGSRANVIAGSPSIRQ